MVGTWAILDADGWLVNVVVWDGETPWTPPEGTTAELYDPEVHLPRPEQVSNPEEP